MHGHPPGLPAAPADVRCPRSLGRIRRRALPATMLALVLLAGASACSSDDTADPPDTTVAAPPKSTTTIAPTTTTEPKSEEDEVAEAYLEAQDVYFRALVQPAGSNDQLREFFEEPYLSDVRGVLRQLERAGLVATYPNEGPPVPAVRDVSVDGSEAVVEVCIVNDGQQTRADDGSVVNDAVVSQVFSAQLIRRDKAWLVKGGNLVESWPDGKGCDR